MINEGEKIQKQLKKMRSISETIDVIIADGRSTDNSLELKILKMVVQGIYSVWVWALTVIIA